MNGTTPDPTDPARDAAAVSRLRLAEALRRAKFAIAWERSWPHLARFLTVVGLFLVVSWAGLWLALPSLARVIGLLLVAVLALAGLLPLLKFRWPAARRPPSAGPRRSVRHRPATALTDTLASRDRWRWRCGRRSASARWPR